MTSMIEKFWGDRGVRNIFLIFLVLSLSAAFLGDPIINKIERNKLEKGGITTNGEVIGIWRIPKRQPLAVYMFLEGDEYYTGTFSYSYNLNIKKGDNLKIIYLEKDPDVNRCIQIIPKEE